jgi:hypothetical protein
MWKIFLLGHTLSTIGTILNTTSTPKTSKKECSCEGCGKL